MEVFDASPADRTSSGHLVWWIVGGIGGLVGLSCAGGIVLLTYIGLVGPETSVYTGNQVPKRFIETARSVGALEDGEELLYFYSDALSDIRDGFYFVSDRRVVVYSETTGTAPLTVIPFTDIADVHLYRNESFIEDSEITIELKDGQVISFPVSSEYDKDQAFFDAIQERIEVTE